MKPLVAIALLALALQAQAETVYRCGADGRTFSGQPCPDGTGVQFADERTPAQRHQAAEAARKDAKLAAQWTREREQRDGLARRQGAAGIVAQAPASAASAASAPKPHRSKRTRKPQPPIDSDPSPVLKTSASK
jgi:hypothetical protein